MTDLIKMIAMRDPADLSRARAERAINEDQYLDQLRERRLETVNRLQALIPELQIGKGFRLQGEVFLHAEPPEIMEHVQRVIAGDTRFAHVRVANVIPYEYDEEPMGH